jgi:hypothetical protein
MMMRRFALVLLLGACTVGEDEATEGTPGASVSNPDNERLNGCHGQASSSVPANGKYTLTTFGGPGDHQSMSCGGYADGSTWYAASRQRYGCGAKLKIEANGKCVVTEALDYGPDVCVENAAGMPIIDASPKVSKALFGESGAGWSDHMVVTVTEVPKATPVGPCTASPPPAGMMCDSATLGREVDEGVCVQAASDKLWYECEGGEWVGRSSSAGCAQAYGFCSSATLGTAVPPRTCVQAGSDSVWYQCNGQGWVTPVSTSTKTGPIGVCSTWNPL